MISTIVRTLLLTLLLVHACHQSALAQTNLERLRFPLTKSEALRSPTFVLDVSEVPDDAVSQKWGENAKELCEEWFPVLCKFLSTDTWTPPEMIRLVIKKELEAPGSTSGHAISVSLKWITEHPDDFGMVIHELVHVIQNYPHSRKNPGWLVEGIADYLRYWKYEAEAPRRRIEATASYRDGYGTSGAFLAWMTWKYDRRVVRRLDSALRMSEYKDSIFRDVTGKDLPELWTEFLEFEQREGR